MEIVSEKISIENIFSKTKNLEFWHLYIR